MQHRVLYSVILTFYAYIYGADDSIVTKLCDFERQHKHLHNRDQFATVEYEDLLKQAIKRFKDSVETKDDAGYLSYFDLSQKYQLPIVKAVVAELVSCTALGYHLQRYPLKLPELTAAIKMRNDAKLLSRSKERYLYAKYMHVRTRGVYRDFPSGVTFRDIRYINKQYSYPGANLNDLHLAHLTSLEGINEDPVACKQTCLYLNANRIPKVPVMSAFKVLHQLYLQNNHIEEFPLTLQDLEQLKYLELNRNRIQKVPDNITGFENLVSLDLCANQISYFPTIIRGLQKLRMLFLRTNQLTEFDGRSLSSLEELQIANNKLITMPQVPASLQRLRMDKNSINKEIHDEWN